MVGTKAIDPSTGWACPAPTVPCGLVVGARHASPAKFRDVNQILKIQESLPKNGTATPEQQPSS